MIFFIFSEVVTKSLQSLDCNEAISLPLRIFLTLSLHKNEVYQEKGHLAIPAQSGQQTLFFFATPNPKNVPLKF